MLYRGSPRYDWEKARPLLERMKREQNPEWMVEDLWAACEFGAAELWLDTDRDGVLILQTKEAGFGQGKILLIWVAALEGGHGLEDYMPLIEDIAKERGCSIVEFWSNRRGMERLVARANYQVHSTVYRKKV